MVCDKFKATLRQVVEEAAIHLVRAHFRPFEPPLACEGLSCHSESSSVDLSITHTIQEYHVQLSAIQLEDSGNVQASLSYSCIMKQLNPSCCRQSPMFQPWVLF